MSECGAGIRPFPNDTELRCEVIGGAHARHQSTLRDYAYPGSATVFHWDDGDRRNFYGEWPGKCGRQGNVGNCVLPLGHGGNHAS